MISVRLSATLLCILLICILTSPLLLNLNSEDGRIIALQTRTFRYGNDSDHTMNRLCRQLNKLERLDNPLGPDEPPVNEDEGLLGAKRIRSFKATAEAAREDLEALRANDTLVQECQAMQARKEDLHRCRKMARLEKLAGLADNQTALENFVEGKGKAGEKIEEKIANAEEELRRMQENGTLVEFCAGKRGVSDDGEGGIGASSAAEAEAIGLTGSGHSATPQFMFCISAVVFAVAL